MSFDGGHGGKHGAGVDAGRGEGRAGASSFGSMFFFGGGGGGGSGSSSSSRIRYERRDHYSIPYTNMSPEKQQLRIVDDAWERAAKYYTFSTNTHPPSPQGSVGSCASTASSVCSTSASVSSASASEGAPGKAPGGRRGGGSAHGHVPDVEFDRLDLDGLEHVDRQQLASM